MKINEKHENHSFCNTFHAKSMKILPHNLLKIIKIDEKSMQLHWNSWKNIGNQWTSTENPLKSQKIHKNLENSMKINEGHENHSFCNFFHAKSMKTLPHNLLKITKIDAKSMKINWNSWKTIENRWKSTENLQKFGENQWKAWKS